MSRPQRAAQRLTTGSTALARRLANRACTWCAHGRREDLDGWRAVLGVIGRMLLLALGAYLLARIVRALPALMWALSSVWLVAAWRAAPREPAMPEEETPPELDGGAVRTLLLDLMGTGSAVHLRTVLTHLQKHPPTAGLTARWTIADLRSRMEALGIPVQPKVKVRGVPTRGVRREDVEALSPTAAPESSPAPSPAV